MSVSVMKVHSLAFFNGLLTLLMNCRRIQVQRRVTRWSQPDLETLKRMASGGYTAAEIGRKLNAACQPSIRECSSRDRADAQKQVHSANYEAITSAMLLRSNAVTMLQRHLPNSAAVFEGCNCMRMMDELGQLTA